MISVTDWRDKLMARSVLRLVGGMGLAGAKFVGSAPLAAQLPQPMDPFGGRTVALNCGTEPEKVPATVFFACRDGNGQFQNVRWTSWRDDVAEATADKEWAECIPACYNGAAGRKPVRIVLPDVLPIPAGHAFLALTAHDDRGARSTTLPAFEFGGEWIVQ